MMDLFRIARTKYRAVAVVLVVVVGGGVVFGTAVGGISAAR